jgi:hypothetical protein
MILILTACLPTSTTMTGAVMDAQTDGAPVPDAEITIRSPTGNQWDAAVADTTGTFEVTLPIHSIFYFSAAAEGFTTTVFTGVTDESPVEVPDGTLWMRSPDEIEALIQDFGDCGVEDSANGGGTIEGEIRMQVVENSATDSLPLVTTAAVLAYDESGVAYPGCYFDDDGVASADSSRTGETGRFAIFGVPSGIISLQIRYDYGGIDEQEDWYPLYMPDNGTIPMWPTLVSMPSW